MGKKRTIREKAYKGRLRGNSSASPLGSRRCSKRLLEAKSPQHKSTGNTRPMSPDSSTMEKIAEQAKIVTQDTCSASLSAARDVLTTKKVGNKTPSVPQVLISSRNIKKSYTRAGNLAPAHSRTGPPCQAKRGKFIQEKNTNNSSEEESVNNSQLSLTQRGDRLRKKTTKENPQEEFENHFHPSLTIRGSLIQEKNTNDTSEEEYDYNFERSLTKTGNLLQEKATNGPTEEEPENNFEPSLTKRGSLIQEKTTSDTSEEEFEYNFQPSLTKTGNLVQEKTTNGTSEEESEKNFEASLTKRGSLIQEKNTNDSLEEEFEYNFRASLTKTGNLVKERATNDTPEEERENSFQPCLAKRRKFVQETNTSDSPDDECKDNCQPCNSKNPTQVEVNHFSAEVSLNNHTPSVSVMAITEIAALNEKHPHDEDEEIISCYKPALVTVGGYRVKEEFASLSRNILEKYGDILQNCTLRMTYSRSPFLEMICDIIQRLQGSDFKEITTGEVEIMLKQVADMDTICIEVDWLRKRLDEIYKAKHKFVNSSLLKEEKDKIRKVVKDVERELGHAEMMVVHLKEKLDLLRSDVEEIERAAFDTCAKVNNFLRQPKSLVDGLL